MDDLDLDRELHRALQVTPSPEFVARVRTKIAEAPRPSTWAGVLRPAAAVTCVVAAAIAAGIWQSDARLKPGPTGAVPTVDAKVSDAHSDKITAPTTPTRPVGAQGVAPSRAARDDGRAITSSTPAASANANTASTTAAQPPMPEVIIARDDIKALQQFVASAAELRFVASFEATPASTPWVMNDLSIAPITVEPLERQVMAHN